MIVTRVDEDDMTVDEVTSVGAMSLVLLHMFNMTLSVNKFQTVVPITVVDIYR